MTDKQRPFGGEIWTQNRFPYMTRYIVTGVPSDQEDPDIKHSHLALSSDPREIGNTLCDRDVEGHMTFTAEQLTEYLHNLDYECEGQLYHLLMEEKYPGFIDELKTIKGREKEWTGK